MSREGLVTSFLRHVAIRALYIAVATAGLFLLTPPGAALFLWAAILLALGEGVLGLLILVLPTGEKVPR